MMAASSSNISKVSKGSGSGNSKKCCIFCGNNGSFGSQIGEIEVACKFLETLNLVWSSLEETMRQTTGSPDVKDKKCSENGGGGGGCKFLEVPPLCQVCAHRIESMKYFKGQAERYLEKLRKSMEEAQTEASASGASSFSSKSKEKETPKECMETQQKLEDIQRATLILPWKPKFLQNMSPSSSSPSSSQDQSAVSMETQQIERTTCGILNKITNSGHNFDILICQLVANLPFLKDEQDINPDNKLILKTVASLIVNKAVKEPFYCPAYARLIHVICKISGKFRKFVLDVCQSQFQQQICEEVEEDSSEENLEDMRQRCFGIVNFIQELSNFKFKLVTPKILVSCLDALLEHPVNQLKVECIHKFIAAEKFEGEDFPFGYVIDVQLKALEDAVKGGENVKFLPEDGWMDKLFENLKEFSKNTTKFNGRIRCLLENLVELREHGWRKQDKKSGIARKIGEAPRGKFVWKPNPPNEEPALTLWLFERKTRGILNKVNLKDGKLFDRNFYRLLKLPYWYCGEYSNNEKQILKAGEMIFEKAVKEPMFCDGYAELVQRIGQFRKKYPYSRNFGKIREIVVELCIEEICKISGGDAHADHVEGEAEKFGERERIFGVIKFIGELYRSELFSSRNMGTCMQLLIGDGEISEIKMECVCSLLLCKFVNGETSEMVYYGEFLDVQLSVLRMAVEEDDEDLRWIDEMFGMDKKFGEDSRFGGRIRCLLENLMELRDNGWKDKSQAGWEYCWVEGG